MGTARISPQIKTAYTVGGEKWISTRTRQVARMGKSKQKYRKFHRLEADRIHADIVEFIRQEGKVAENQDRFFNLFGDAYERGYCGPLSYRLYDDTLRIEWIASKPTVCGDTIVAYVAETATDLEGFGNRIEQNGESRTVWL